MIMSTPKVQPVSPMVAWLDPTICRESFPSFNFFGFINLSQMNVRFEVSLLSWRLIREAEAYRTPISANARCKRGVEASKV
jgi:hypothetical protein